MISLKSYLEHFNAKVAQVTKVPEGRLLMELTERVKPETTMWRNLQKQYCLDADGQCQEEPTKWAY